MRAKKLPKLETLTANATRKPKQNWQQQMAIMSLWASTMRRIEGRKHGR